MFWVIFSIYFVVKKGLSKTRYFIEKFPGNPFYKLNQIIYFVKKNTGTTKWVIPTPPP